MSEVSANIPNSPCTRRAALKQFAGAAVATGTVFAGQSPRAEAESALGVRPWITVRGIYGGYPSQILDRGSKPADYGINAVWVGSGSLSAEQIDRYHKLGLKVFAEFNSMHSAQFLKDHPDAAPIGPDGKPSPAPSGWQGVSAVHSGYRANRMDEFRRLLGKFEVDGIWLDYHHAHASWEQAEPEMPDTDFSPAALKLFTERTGIELPPDIPSAAKSLLSAHRRAWIDFRCALFTDWVREYRSIRDAVRPQALLGTFHCPWSESDFGGAIREKLAIDLKAHAQYIDVFSIMPYHARFGHASDLGWISRQIQQLGQLIGVAGKPNEKNRIWPIVQLADWGETVSPAQIDAIVEQATRPPTTGITVFHWSGISKDWAKADALKKAYLSIAPH
jgi:hypothetical protein